MTTTQQPAASAPPPDARKSVADSNEHVAKPAGNATAELAAKEDRKDARHQQEILQSEGHNALPVPGYPVKEQSPAANEEDKRQNNATPGTRHRGR